MMYGFCSILILIRGEECLPAPDGRREEADRDSEHQRGPEGCEEGKEAAFGQEGSGVRSI